MLASTIQFSNNNPHNLHPCGRAARHGKAGTSTPTDPRTPH
ncbi:hypothetical protein ACVWWH_004038, partial [Sinomonas sp. RB5]